MHLEYEVEHALLAFVDDAVPLLTPFGEEDDDRSEYRKARDAIDDHLVFTVEDYVETFGSVTAALFKTGALRGVGSRCPIDGPEDEPSGSSLQGPKPSPETKPHLQYGPNWKEVRASIKQRDGFACRVCERSTGQLHVHHITPAREFLTPSRDTENNYETMNEPTNLITLCPACHGHTEGKWTDLSPQEFTERARDHLDLTR